MLLLLTSVAQQTLDKCVNYLPQYHPGLKVAFIPTAGSLYRRAPWQQADRDKLEQMGFSVKTVELQGLHESDLKRALDDIDIIFVAGGNTFYLLEHAIKSGFLTIARELIKKGVIYIGSSAGSVLVGPNIEPVNLFDNPNEAHLSSFEGMGLVDFIVLPHYGSDDQSLYEKVLLRYKDLYKFIPLRNDQAIVVTEEGYKII